MAALGKQQTNEPTENQQITYYMLLTPLLFAHEQLTFKFQGRRFRLTDVHGHIVREVIA